MIRNITLLTTGLFLFPLAHVAAEQAQLPESFEKEIGEIVTGGIEEGLYPGGVFVFGDGDDIIFQGAWGNQTFDSQSPAMAMDTIFDMASVTKVVATATMSLDLIENGKLDPDEKVSEIIPEFAAHEKESVMVRDLLTHTSGLKAYESFSVVERARKENSTHAEALIARYSDLERKYETRKDYVYSCLNFQTLAHINEVRADGNMDSYLKKNIWSRIGMEDTTYLPTGSMVSRIAPTHRNGDGADMRVEIHDPLARYHGTEGRMPGNAGLFSTGSDMAKFCQMVLNHGKSKPTFLSRIRITSASVLDEETIQRATAIQTPLSLDEHRGFGFDVYESGDYIHDANTVTGHHVVGHSGYTGTLFLIDQHAGIFMVFLTNRTYPADPEASDQTPSISPVRKTLWKKVRELYYPAADSADQVSRSNQHDFIGQFTTGDQSLL